MVEFENRDEVTVVRLRHGKVNALDLELLSELNDKLDELEKSPSKAIVLTGFGGAFSAGVDLLRVVDEGRPYVDRFVPMLTASLLKLFTFPKPTVAAINGHAIAGGAILAWACDHTIMALNSGMIGIVELLVGVPFPSLPLEIVRYAVPAEQFQSLVYSGDLFDAEKAFELGLINSALPAAELETAALERARKYANIPSESFSATKKLMRQPALDRYERYAASLDAETKKIWAKDEILQSISTYLDKTLRRKK